MCRSCRKVGNENYQFEATVMEVSVILRFHPLSSRVYPESPNSGPAPHWPSVGNSPPNFMIHFGVLKRTHWRIYAPHSPTWWLKTHHFLLGQVSSCKVAIMQIMNTSRNRPNKDTLDLSFSEHFDVAHKKWVRKTWDISNPKGHDECTGNVLWTISGCLGPVKSDRFHTVGPSCCHGELMA